MNWLTNLWSLICLKSSKGVTSKEEVAMDLFYLIRKWEGFRSEAYKCSAHRWTVGFGSTFYPDGSSVKEGDTITKQEAENLLAWYCVTQITLPKGTFNPKQKMALYSIYYNVGSSFSKSKCCKAIEKQEWETAFKEWNWDKAGEKTIKGLAKRRKEERLFFFDGLVDIDLLEEKYYS